MSTQAVSELRQRMIEDMKARQLTPNTQRSHIYSCKRLAAYLKRSPAAATADEVRAFQLYLMETGPSICNRNRIMTGVKFLFRVTLRRHDLVSEIYYVREPQKLPLTMSQAEAKRLLAAAGNLKAEVMLTLCYGCGLRAGEVSGDIDSELNIIRIVHQGPQGPPRHAAARSARFAAAMVEGAARALRRRCAAEGAPAFPGPQAWRAPYHPSALAPVP